LVAPQLALSAKTSEWATLAADARNLVAWLERMNERPSMKATTWEKAAEMARAPDGSSLAARSVRRVALQVVKMKLYPFPPWPRATGR